MNKNDCNLPDAPVPSRTAKADSLIVDKQYMVWNRTGLYPLIQRPDDYGYLQDVMPEDNDFMIDPLVEFIGDMCDEDEGPQEIDINGNIKKRK